MKYKWYGSVVFLSACLLLGSGCATRPGGYANNLKNDFLDISRVNIGAGPIGYGADVKATKFLQLKADNYEGVTKAGWIGRGYGVWKEMSKGYAFCTKQMPVTTHEETVRIESSGDETATKVSHTKEEIITFEQDFLAGASADVFQPRITSLMEDEENKDEKNRVLDLFSPADEFKVSAYAGVVGADIGFRPVELLDCICNLLTFGHVDLRKDDQLPLGDLPAALLEEQD